MLVSNVEENPDVGTSMWRRIQMLANQCGGESRCWQINVEENPDVGKSMWRRIQMFASQCE